MKTHRQRKIARLEANVRTVLERETLQHFKEAIANVLFDKAASLSATNPKLSENFLRCANHLDSLNTEGL